jgi:alpha-ketoglutarate-dependent taurine dioxygenase
VTKRRDEGISARLATRRRFGVVNWDTATYDKKFDKIEYEEYMQDGSVFWSAIRDLARWGVVFLKNVPCEEDSIVKIATRIANIRETFYGRTFDVKAKPRAENVAYTSGYLGLHQDLLYLEPPPHIQVLHCMENSCQGGESLFSDGDRIARMLWQLRDQHPVRSLVDVPVPYAYDRNGYRYRQERPMLVGETGLDGIQVFRNFFWSPPFQGVFDKPVDMTSWIEAAKIFESLVNAEDAVYKTKMEPGDAVFFDNLRVLHGRTAFDAEGGGSRWLRGTYIDAQDFFSTASHAPDTHAADGKDEDALWDEQRHMEDLARSPWYSSLLERLASRA